MNTKAIWIASDLQENLFRNEDLPNVERSNAKDLNSKTDSSKIRRTISPRREKIDTDVDNLTMAAYRGEGTIDEKIQQLIREVEKRERWNHVQAVSWINQELMLRSMLTYFAQEHATARNRCQELSILLSDKKRNLKNINDELLSAEATIDELDEKVERLESKLAKENTFSKPAGYTGIFV